MPTHRQVNVATSPVRVELVGLVVGLSIGIAEARSDRMYWRLAIGLAVNLSLMYVARKDIKRLKKLLDLDSSAIT